MAVYTDIGDEDLAAFLTQYDIGEALVFKGIAEGVSNSNFFLQTTGGRFILTLYEKRIEEADIPYFLALMEHMAARGVHCPPPIRGRDGAVVRKLCGRSAALIGFLDGLSPKRPSVVHCGEAGLALARLHAAGGDFPLHRANALSLDSWKAMAAESAPRADDVAHGLSAIIAEEVAFLGRVWPRDLPAGVVHADLFPDNTLFVGGNLTGVIDFYFACDDFHAYDLAIGLTAWCFEGDGAFNYTKGRALLSRYTAERAISAAEAEALPILARGAALRFLLTRLHDWLNQEPGALVRPKDPRECLAQLMFHRGVKDAGAYGL